MADTDARPVDQDALVADIDRTRADLARTIDAISERVSPKRNMDRALEQARQRVSEVSQRVNREVGQVSQRVNREVSQRAGQIDPVMVGAAAAAVLVGVTVLFLVRRRKH
jgi:tetrahydromethanopterin S-methyltransferase subunit G